MNNKNPEVGEWWLVKSKDTLRMAVMIKTSSGWGGILNSEGRPIKDYIQTRDIFTPIHRMVPK